MVMQVLTPKIADKTQFWGTFNAFLMENNLLVMAPHISHPLACFMDTMIFAVFMSDTGTINDI